jgi:hypothetical protein
MHGLLTTVDNVGPNSSIRGDNGVNVGPNSSLLGPVTNVIISGLIPRTMNHYLSDSSCLCPQVFPMYGEGRFSARASATFRGIDLFWVSSVRPHPLPLPPQNRSIPGVLASGGCAQARAQAHPPEGGACARAKAPLTVHGKHLGTQA